ALKQELIELNNNGCAIESQQGCAIESQQGCAIESQQGFREQGALQLLEILRYAVMGMRQMEDKLESASNVQAWGQVSLDLHSLRSQAMEHNCRCGRCNRVLFPAVDEILQ
ncbi:MAG: hypothetical protein ACRDL7_15330, partial [Gaiellaceae bacterium]